MDKQMRRHPILDRSLTVAALSWFSVAALCCELLEVSVCFGQQV